MKPLSETVSGWIAAAQKNQQEISQLSGVPQSAISEIRTGKRTGPSADIVTRIATACGVSATGLGRALRDCYPIPADKRAEVPQE